MTVVSQQTAPSAQRAAVRPAETTEVHTRIMRCALEVPASRAFWQHGLEDDVSADRAFTEYWFGAKSLARCRVLVSNFRARYAAFPQALIVLAGWTDMAPGTRALIAHWHLQLTDPFYRIFTGEWLVERRSDGRDVTRDIVVDWVGDHGRSNWTMASRIQVASKLLSAAYSAGLVSRNRDPRPVVAPRVRDDAITYLMYLLRGVEFEGTLLDNPYTRSVGLDPDWLVERLTDAPAVRVRRQGDLVDFTWEHDSLSEWGEAR